MAFTADEVEARLLNVMYVSKGFFEFLGLEPAQGRPFSEEEYQRGRDQVAVISHGLWRSAFGGDPGVIGRELTLNGRTRTVVGVGPPDFPKGLPGLGRADVWLPFGYAGVSADSLPSRGRHSFLAMARLAPGVGADAAEAELDALMDELQRLYPGPNQGKQADLVPLHQRAVADATRTLVLLLGAVGIVLCIAVANVTSILLGRAADRESEIALRSALGAGRSRIVGQLVVESVLLSGAGGLLGLGLAYWGTKRVLAWGAGSIPLTSAVRVDGTVLAATFTIAALAGLFMGVVPAWSAGRRDLHVALRDGGGERGSSGRGRLKLRGALVVAQVAFSITLLTGAGLLLRSLAKLTRVETGLDTSVLTFGVELPRARYQDWSEHDHFHADLEERLARIPGVVSVASTNGVPLSGVGICGSLAAEEDPERFAGGDVCAQVRSVTPDYFEVMGIPFVAGGSFTDAEEADRPQVIVINQAVADLLWPGENPLGRRVMTGFLGIFQEVVGVVPNVKQFRLDEEPVYQTYVPHVQWRNSSRHVLVSHSSAPERLLPAIREAVWSLDPNLPVYDVATVDALRRETLGDERFRALLLGAMAALALVLAAVGIYGTISYSVAQRRREMAIRLSIGAGARRVVGMIVGQGLRLVAAGLVLGGALSVILARALRSMLFSVSTTDPVTLGAVAVVLAGAGLLATLIPAARATGVDPITVLRQD